MKSNFKQDTQFLFAPLIVLKHFLKWKYVFKILREIS